MALPVQLLEIEEASTSDEDVVSRPPSADEKFCGIDIRPWLPVALILIILFLGAAVIFVQGHLLGEWLDSTVAYVVHIVLAMGLSLLTVGMAVYCAWADPGRMRVTRGGLRNTDGDLEAANEDLPPRAHRTWLYNHPIRRYDHYCRWVHNAIALHNHRTFIAMLYALVVVPALHVLGDLVLICYVGIHWQSWRWWQLVVLIIHLGIAGILLYKARPICALHTTLVSQSLLSSEWKVNRYHNVERSGQMKPAEETDVESGDEEVYDATRNPFDKGSASENCLTFWCTSRNASEPGAF